MNKDNLRPVTSIKHDDKRAAIPDSAHQGEEQMAISGQPEWSQYQVFRHEFQRGRDPELYWLGKYKNDDEDSPDYMPQLRTDIRSLYKHEDIRPEAIIDNLYELHEHKSESAKLQLDLFGDWAEEEDGDKKDFAAWRKGLDTVAKDLAKKKAERTLRLEFNEDIWDTLYGFKSEPIPYEKGKRIAVRVVSQFGEESTKVLEM